MKNQIENLKFYLDFEILIISLFFLKLGKNLIPKRFKSTKEFLNKTLDFNKLKTK